MEDVQGVYGVYKHIVGSTDVWGIQMYGGCTDVWSVEMYWAIQTYGGIYWCIQKYGGHTSI